MKPASLQPAIGTFGKVRAEPSRPETITLLEGDSLTITGNAATGTVQRIGSADSWAISGNNTVNTPCYKGTQTFLIKCTAGSIDATVGDALLGLPVFSGAFDGVALYDSTVGVTAGGITPVSSPSALFRNSDIGKVVCWRQNSQTAYKFGNGVITSVSGDGLTANCTMYVDVPAQITPATFVYGTDVTQYIKNLMANASAKQTSVSLPSGIACVTDRFTTPMGVALFGQGRNTAIGASAEWTYIGTSIVLCKAVTGINNSFIRMSNAVEVYGSQTAAHNKPQCVIRDLNIDANFSAFYVLDMSGGFGNEVREVSACRPANVSGAGASILAGNSSRIYNTTMDAHSAGRCLEVSAVSDVKIKNNWLSSPATGVYCAKISACTDVQYHGNHSFRNGTSPGIGGQVMVEAWSGGASQLISIQSNVFDTSNGPHVYVTVTGGSNAQAVDISKNICMQNDSIAANTYPMFEINVAASSTLTGYNLQGNEAISSFGSSANGVYTSMLKITNAGTFYAERISDNIGLRCNAMFEGVRPANHSGNIIRVGTTTNIQKDDASGITALNGTGAATSFTIAHGLDAAPTQVNATPGSLAAAGFSYVTADSTNITVNYASAPASGTGNVAINWSARS